MIEDHSEESVMAFNEISTLQYVLEKVAPRDTDVKQTPDSPVSVFTVPI